MPLMMRETRGGLIMKKLSDFTHPSKILNKGERFVSHVQREIDGVNRFFRLPKDPSIPLNEGYRNSNEYQLIFEEMSGCIVWKKWHEDTETMESVLIPLEEFEEAPYAEMLGKQN